MYLRKHVGALALCIFAVVACAPADPNAVPRGFETVDHEIEIGMRIGRLRYDVEEFTVRPGSKVKLTLANNDSMQHNLLICRPEKGVVDRVAAAALTLGDKASERDFVPRHRGILHHTKLVDPGETHTIWFRAPKRKAAYPYVCTLPGHSYTMRGVMKVGEIPKPLLSGLRYDFFEGSFKKLADLEAREPTRTGLLKKGLLDLGALDKRSNYGVWFHGTLQVPRSGKYTFFLRSDDGSRVRVDGKEIVAHDGTHPPGPDRKGTIRLKKGQKHELRVEFFQAGGGQALHVDIEGPGLPRTKLCVTAKKSEQLGIPIMVMHEPVVMRVHVEDASPRSIAVGLPGGMNCVFDANTCSVEFGWAGAFLDVGPDRLGRGGRPCRILGKRFQVGNLGFPLRRQGADRLAVQYRGYKTGKQTRFLIDWDGQEVHWMVDAATSGIGLQYTFELPGVSSELQFALARPGLEVEASAGTWKDGVLTIPASDAARFVVTLRSTGGAK